MEKIDNKNIGLNETEKMLILPRVSEKSGAMMKDNKYAFKVPFKANKVEVRKSLEKQYGVKIATVNMIRTPGKTKRSGRGVVKTSGLKKAIVTLTKDSKKFEVVENV